MTDPVADELSDHHAAAHVIPGDGALIPVPSGQPVMLQDVIWNVPGPDGLAVRFRFVAPQIVSESGATPYEVAAEDMMHLCQTYALPRLAEFGPQPTQIIVSMSDQPVPFGEAMPEATQFFEAFSYHDGICIWEIF
ncbi:DUF6497 family protein [Pseudotabrizicola sp. 4114]|uniref:DUF6497 family protein n=1 Tax=Pseudotabrizicola sp. 4114 TaxID=2817731 RepID=UPI00285BF3FA|nr:hypothetical protein [Pseudorhodobacter sp. 4114]